MLRHMFTSHILCKLILINYFSVMLKIISWNIRQGGGTRINSICNNLIKSDEAVIILSEYRNNASGMKIRNSLLKAGYRYQNVTAAKADVNSAAIFSKIPCNQILYPNADEDFPHNILCSEFEALKVYGMYLPHKKKHKLFDFILNEVDDEKPCILAGDFNTGKNYIDQKGNSFWYTDKMEALEKKGYADAFRHINGDVKEYSWYSHQGNGFRYDHTYVHSNLLPITKACYYIHEWRENKLSDHSPMVIELG